MDLRVSLAVMCRTLGKQGHSLSAEGRGFEFSAFSLSVIERGMNI